MRCTDEVGRVRLVLYLQELVAPVRDALEAVGGLLGVGPADVLHPVHKQLLVLLQHQELAQDDVRLGGEKQSGF